MMLFGQVFPGNILNDNVEIFGLIVESAGINEVDIRNHIVVSTGEGLITGVEREEEEKKKRE